MLKLTCLIILTISFFFVTAQREPVYKYSYDFSISTSPACATSVLLDSATTSTQQPLLDLELKDCNNSAIPFATVSLKAADSSHVERVFDDKGKISIALAQGEYTLTIVAVGTETLTRKISLSQYHKQHLQIVLQAGAFRSYYTVSSKIKLTKKDIDKIKKCIINAKGEAYKCSEKDVYHIMTWI